MIMKQNIMKIIFVAALLLMAGGMNAASTLTHELGNNVTVKWYSDEEKTTEITDVTLTGTAQFVYVDIQPANGYWTDLSLLSGVEKIASLGNADSRRTTRGDGVPLAGMGAISKLTTQTYDADGGGLYEVTVPALVDGQTADQITHINLKGTVKACTDLSTATITASSATYSGVAQTASTISVVLGSTSLTAGTDYTVTTNAGGTNAGKYAVGITGMGHYKGTATDDDAFEITTKALTITANAQTITYGGSITSSTEQVTTGGLVTGDDLTSITLTKNKTDYSAEAYANDITPSDAVVKRDDTDVTANYNITYISGALTIDKATPVVTAPTGLELEYTGNAQQLIEAGETTFGSLLYSLSEDGTYSEEIPTGTAVSTYTIWYKVDANDNWYGVDKQSVTASIMGYPVKVGAGCYATYYSDTALSTDDADAILYTITEVGETSVTLEQITSANALMPFLVYNNSDTDKTILLQPTEAEVSLVVAKEFKGTTVNKDMPASSSETDYYVCTGKAFVWTKWAGMIGANRCWIEINDQPETSRTRTRSITGGNTTGIDSVDSGQWTDDSYYNLQGRKVMMLKRRGIYIKNGQKVVVK